MAKAQAELLLQASFAEKHVAALIRHFEAMTKHFQHEEWENCIAKSGKFVEAVLKALIVFSGQTLATGKDFKADKAINTLTNLAAGSAHDTIRITIPRACRFVYEIASNRGGRHDPDEIDPNVMDANVVMGNCAWVVAEMIRHAQHGVVDTASAKKIVDSLVTRKYPVIEEVDGRTYFHLNSASAPDIALVALNHRYPGRISSGDLIKLLKRHHFTENNARTALQRISKYVDEDDSEQLRLLAPGMKKAEEIMSTQGGQK